MPDTVNEKSSATLRVSFFDNAGVAAVPTTITYRIDNDADSAEIKGDTAVSPVASTVNILLTATDNRIIKSTAERELHKVTVTATFGASEQTVSEFKLTVRNLNFHPPP
jgi:hypothetical protein